VRSRLVRIPSLMLLTCVQAIDKLCPEGRRSDNIRKRIMDMASVQNFETLVHHAKSVRDTRNAHVHGTYDVLNISAVRMANMLRSLMQQNMYALKPEERASVFECETVFRFARALR
jgi:hypothetical protein